MKKKQFIFALVAMLGFTFSAFAQTTVSDADELKAALEAGGDVTLGADITVSAPVTVSEGVTVALDLNGKKLKSKGVGHPVLENNGNLTINGSGTVTGIIYNGKTESSKAEMTLNGGTYNLGENDGGLYHYGKTLTINDGVVVQTNMYGIRVLGAKSVLNLYGGSYSSTNSTVSMRRPIVVNKGAVNFLDKDITVSGYMHVMVNPTAINFGENNVNSPFEAYHQSNSYATAVLYCKTLQEAINRTDFPAVTLVKNVKVALDAPIVVNKTINLNLNGRNLSAPAAKNPVLKNLASLTINGKGTVTGAVYNGASDNKGVAELTLNGGTYKLDGNNGGIYHYGKTLTVNKGVTVDTKMYGVRVSNKTSVLNINGGKFKATNTEFNMDRAIAVEAGTVNFNSADVDYTGVLYANRTNATVNFGESTPFEVQYIEPKSAALYYVPNLDAELLKHIKAGTTLTLQKNIERSEILTLDKALTLNGNGKTLSSTAGRAINVDCAGEVNISNLTIEGASNTERAINVISKPANLALNSVVAEGFKYTVNVAKSSTGSNITINGGKYSGYAAINITGNNTNVNVKNAELVGVNDVPTAASNAFAVIALGEGAIEGANVTVKGGTITAVRSTESGKGNAQYIIQTSSAETKNCVAVLDAELNLSEGNLANIDNYEGAVVTVRKEYAEDYITSDAGNGLVTLKGGRAEASINGVKYSTLQKAINAVKEGETIVLISDIELTAQNAQEYFKPAYNRESYCGIVIPDDKVVVLDLNGKTVSYVDTYGDVDNVMVLNLGNLTINDAVGGGKLTYKAVAGTKTYAYFYSTIFNCGTLTINAGTVENTCETETDVTNAVDNHSRLSHEYGNDCVLTVNGGTLSGAYYYAIRQYTHYLEGVKNRVIINGGDINGGVYMQHGDSWYYADPAKKRLNVDCFLTINGGNINVNATPDAFGKIKSRLSNPDNNVFGLAINGGNINVPVELLVQRGVYYTNGVSGATTPAETAGTRNAEWLEKNDGFINGGKFTEIGSADEPTMNVAAFVVKGYELAENGDGTYGIIESPKGGKIIGYTREDAIWGESWGNAVSSFIIKVLDANDNVMGTTSLNNVGGIIDGDVTATWSLLLDAASNKDEYWTMEWTTAPTLDNMPAKVQLWVDGRMVSEGNVVLNGPDDLNKIYAAVTDENGTIISCHTSVAGAAANGNNIALLRDTEEKVMLPLGVALNYNGFTAGNVTTPVAKIGEIYYASLDEAVAAVKTNETIILVADYTGNITLTEKTGLYYTIDGKGKQFNGTITVKALSDTNDNRRITIQNISFKDETAAEVDFITSVETNHYPRLTIKNCTFVGSGDATDVAIRLKSSHSVEISECIGTGLHSFLQNTSGWNLTLDRVQVYESKGAFALGTVQGVTVKGSTIDVATYGIRMDAQYNNNAVIESNTVKAFIPVVVRKASVESTITVQGINTMTATNTDGLWLAVGTSEYEANGTMPTASTGKVRVTLNDTGLSRDGIYGDFVPVAEIEGGTDYATIAEAISAAQPGQKVIVYEGTYAVPTMKAGITIEGQDNVVLEGTLSGTLEDLTLKNLHIKGANAQRWAYAKGDLVFENVTFEATSIYALHFDGITAGATLLYKDCTIIGWAAMSGSPASCTFEGCTFKGNGTYGVIRTYFDATIENCTFDVANVNTTDIYQDGIHAVSGATVTVDNCTNANGDMVNVVNVSGTSVVVLDGVEIKNAASVTVGEETTDYRTFAEALAAAEDGATLTLYQDLNMSEILVLDKAITLDGNGKTLTSTAGRAINIETEGDVAIKNLTIVAKGERAINIINKPANVTVENVTATAKNYAVMMATSATGANLTVNNSDLTGLATVNVASAGSYVEINNTNITNLDNNTAENYGAISVFKTATNAKVVVNGGKVVVSDDSLAASIGAEGATVTFNGTEGAEKVQTIVAYVGDAGFPTLDEAIEYAKAGETVVVFSDVTIAKKLLINKSITIDGNGKTLTYTGTDRAIDVPNDANANLDVTIKNLNVVATTANRGLNYNDNGKFNVEGVTVTIGENVDGYAINFPGMADNAQVTIKDSKLTSRNPLNIWGENMTINVHTSEIISVDNSTIYDYAAIQLNNEIPTAGPNGAIANGTVVNVYGGTITATNEKGEPSNVVANATETGVVNISDETVVSGKVLDYVANIGGAYFGSLQAAVDAIEKHGYNSPIGIMKDFATSEATTIKKGLKVTINLNGKTITGTDNATGSFGLITNNGELTINGEGAITLVATNDRDWNAYSSVISNSVGGKLTVNGGTIQHLGGTDMAYGIDNLTNGKGTYAETIINGGVIKSTYRAIRQFLNGVEAQNILTVNGGVIEGANKSIWMQDPSKNANTGKLTVSEKAQLKGDAYLSVTAGSTAWPVEVSIAAAALQDESKVATSNVPAGYEVAKVNGAYGVYSGAAKIGTTYYATIAEAIAAAKAGETVTVLEGTYAVPTMKAGITIEGQDNVVFEGTLSGTLENLTMKNIHIKGGNAQRWAYAKGDLVFENVTFEATSVYALHFDGITAGATLTYKDCTIIGWAAMSGSPASCTFEGCTFKGNGTYGLIRTYFDATIENCTFDVANVNTTDVYQDGIHAVSGATVTVDNCTNANGDMVNVVNVSGTSVVVLDDVEIKNVAKIGDTYYWTLHEAVEAVEAVEAGEVVTLVQDATGAGVVIDKDITIDFNSKTYTVNSAVGSKGTETLAFQILKDNDVTLKNGTIAVVEDVAEGSKELMAVIMNYSNLTLENMTIDGTGSKEMMYGLSTNNGNVVLAGATTIKVAEGVTAIDVDGAQNSYGAATLSIANDANVIVEGDVAIYGEEASVAITSGSFAGEFSIDDEANVVINGGSFDRKDDDVITHLAYGYQLTGDAAPYAAEHTGTSDVVTIVDGEYENFVVNEEISVNELTYVRDFTNFSGWQSLFVPFEIPVEELTGRGYEVAYFFDVHYETQDDMVTANIKSVHFVKVNKGKLRANYPYVIRRTSEADPLLSLTLYGTKLYSTKESELKKVESSSTTTRFIFAGTYKKANRATLTGDNDTPCYRFTPQGTVQKMSATANLVPFRVCMYINVKEDSPVILDTANAPECIRMRIIGEENEDGTTTIYDVEMDGELSVDYIYDLQGRRVLEPQKGGIYIINGKKVVF